LDLGDQPGSARDDLGTTGLLVYPTLPTFTSELEVLNDVGLVSQLGIDTSIVECTGKQSPRRAHEWKTLYILAVSGLLAHQHD
jgi:hypothetical protein